MSTQLSDFNAAPNKVAMQNLYRDFPMFFTDVHPTKKDISAVKDMEAVKHAVKNLILTNFNERPFHPEIGSNVTAMLFEPADNFTAMSIKEEILFVLKKYEPRTNDHVVEVTDNSERNSYEITIGFNVIFSPKREEINFYLQRLR
jgi:phage baseplate assembly protein W|tara:strand:- start:2409 stop:2843 length:435 start_codon:yes stop_codon:yes gene_type:complete